jgi:predicted MFS family arabinose efflux permease
MIPQLLWTGVSIAYFSGIFVKMMSDSMSMYDAKYQYKWSMLAMVVFGLGEILGCFFTGYIVDKFGSKVASILNVCIVVVMTLVTLAFIVVYKFGWMAFLMTFIWGFQDSMINIHC